MSNIDIIHRFYDSGIIKFGTFTLKDGSTSPFYIDLRLLISHPQLLSDVCTALCKIICQQQLFFNHLAGVPLAGVPISTLISTMLFKSGLLLRREAKEYGCKKAIEGLYNAGETVLLVDDVITSATSKLEAISILVEHKLQCKDILVVVDRRHSKIQQPLSANVHSLFTIDDILSTLLNYDKVTEQDHKCLENIAII